LKKQLDKFIESNRNAVFSLFRHYVRLNRSFLLHPDIRYEYEKYKANETGEHLKDSIVEELIQNTQVAAIESPWIFMSVRSGIAATNYYKYHIDDVEFLACLRP